MSYAGCSLQTCDCQRKGLSKLVLPLNEVCFSWNSNIDSLFQERLISRKAFNESKITQVSIQILSHIQNKRIL